MPFVPIHNENASLANLARTVLSCVDHRRETTAVQTATLVLLLTKFIDFVEPKQAAEVAQAADRSVRQLIASVETAVKNRDEDDYQKRGGEKPRHKGWT